MTNKPNDGERLSVPPVEDVKIIDLELKEVFLAITGIMALAGVGYGLYSHIKAKSDQKRIEAVGTTVSTIVRELASVLRDTEFKPSGQASSNHAGITIKTPGRKAPSEKVAQA